MKRYIRSNTIDDKRIIDIQIVLEYEEYDIAASKLVEHPRNIARKNRINELKLQILNDVAMSAVTAIQSKDHLVIVSQKQASNTYSYYIDFDVLDDNGKKIIPVSIRFRIANHKMQGDETPITSDTVIIRSFVLKGKNYENSIEIIALISKICDELDRGNISILDQYSI